MNRAPVRFACDLLLFGLLVVAGVADPGNSYGESGISIDLPVPTKRIRNGLTVNCDTHWVDANGYRPIKLTFRPVPAPSAITRQIQVKLSYSEAFGINYSNVIRDEVEIPAGSTVVEKIVYLPQRNELTLLKLEFFEAGYRLSDLEYVGGGVNMARGVWTEAAPGILFIDSDTPLRAARDKLVSAGASASAAPATLPDIRALTKLIAEPLTQTGALVVNTTAGPHTDIATLINVHNLPRVQLLSPAELPSEVIGFSCFELIVISLDDAQQMAKEHPQKWEALLAWVRTGTSLVVFGLENDPARQARLDRLLKLPNRPAEWLAPDLSQRSETNVNGSTVQQQFNARMGAYATITGTITATDKTDDAVTNKTDGEEAPPGADFAIRSYGFGKIFGMQNPDPFQSKWQWGWVLNTIGTNQQWFERMGMSLSRRNDDFWNLLVRGVGRPPVILFLVLISLFMIAVGPVNYLLLRTRGKLYLLLFTVPASAALVTLGLITYAILSDGLGVKWRCRSVTLLDQTQGTAVSWARSTYFAGLAPSGGLSFPTDTAVYPLLFEPPSRYQSSGPNRVLDWTHDQRLVAGYLPPRLTSQLMVIRSGECDAKLEIREAREAGKMPQVTNQLETSINALVICDSQGILWSPPPSQDKAAEAILELGQVTPEMAQRYIEQWITASTPTVDLQVDPSFSRNRWWGIDVDGGLGTAPRQSTGMLERTIFRFSNSDVKTLSPRSFVAIVERSPHVLPGCAKVEAKDGFHLVIGKY